MKPDPVRIKNYLAEIRRNSMALNQLIDQEELAPDSVPLKASKYILIHRYGMIDDQRLIGEIKTGRNDFDSFIEEIEAYTDKSRRKNNK